MKPERVKEVLAAIRGVKVVVYGDFCLDAYLMLDSRGSETSVETGIKAEAVGGQKYALGGASNVVANLAALEPASIRVVGVLGDDIFGRELDRQMKALGVDTSGFVIQESDFNTVTYCKRYLAGNEQARIDFGIHNIRTAATNQAVLSGLHDMWESADVIILNQQVPGSMDDESFIDGLNKLMASSSNKIVLLDSRHYGHKFSDVSRKTNEFEAARLNGEDIAVDDVLALPDVERLARTLYDRDGKPVFVSRGPRGLLICDADGVHEVPGIQLLTKLDQVGAGDTALSALGCGLGAGLTPVEAAMFANFAASVTVQKLFQTGTATGEEILAIATAPDYVYQPELAEDIRQAEYIEGSELEISGGLPDATHRVTHAVFDHDGTISTLRQGWEQIIAPVMVRAILGERYESADETLYHKVVNRVSDYIDKSTGIQTILQMAALVEMVREVGVVPADKILDEFGYKEIYNTALMEMVNGRLSKLKSGELDLADFTIKGSVEFLRALRERGVTMYLASGTDKQDVIDEATALGYADLFDGGIYGAVGDVSRYSKKMVIEAILSDNALSGAELVCFGDGPVEIRECRRCEGTAIGVATDEVRRHGLNHEKRSRLVKAGAQLIIPDFSQADMLLGLLFKT